MNSCTRREKQAWGRGVQLIRLSEWGIGGQKQRALYPRLWIHADCLFYCNNCFPCRGHVAAPSSVLDVSSLATGLCSGSPFQLLPYFSCLWASPFCLASFLHLALTSLVNLYRCIWLRITLCFHMLHWFKPPPSLPPIFTVGMQGRSVWGVVEAFVYSTSSWL